MLPLFLFVSSLTFLGWTDAAAAAFPCVSNATYNSANGRCACDDGYKGSPRLCCGPKDQGVCYLISDPTLNTAHDLISEISYPCTTSIAVIKKNINGLECSVRITIAGPYRDDGALFYDRSAVVINFGGSQQFVQFTDGPKFRSSEIINGNMTEPVTENMLEKEEKHIKIGDLSFSVRFDFDNYRWLINGCGGQLVYRPPGPNTQESRPPGICVIAPTDSIAENLSNGEVCNLEPSFNPAPYANKEQAILANMILGYSNIPANELFDPAGYDGQCKNVNTYFKQCTTDKAKAKAIKICGNILLGFTHRKCFQKAPIRVFNFFALCMRATCGGFKSSCNEMQAIPEIQGCLPELKENCDSWSENP